MFLAHCDTLKKSMSITGAGVPSSLCCVDEERVAIASPFYLTVTLITAPVLGKCTSVTHSSTRLPWVSYTFTNYAFLWKNPDPFPLPRTLSGYKWNRITGRRERDDTILPFICFSVTSTWSHVK